MEDAAVHELLTTAVCLEYRPIQMLVFKIKI